MKVDTMNEKNIRLYEATYASMSFMLCWLANSKTGAYCTYNKEVCCVLVRNNLLGCKMRCVWRVYNTFACDLVTPQEWGISSVLCWVNCPNLQTILPIIEFRVKQLWFIHSVFMNFYFTLLFTQWPSVKMGCTILQSVVLYKDILSLL